MREPRKHGRENERGAVLVEMALVVPILLVLFVGTVDYGLVLREYQVLQNAAKEGARLSIMPDYCIATAEAANQGPILDAIRQRVVDYLGHEGITIALTDVTVDQNFSIDLGGGLFTKGSRITVSYTRSLLIGNGWPFGPIALRGEATFQNLQCSS